jgi:hypothetical protein
VREKIEERFHIGLDYVSGGTSKSNSILIDLEKRKEMKDRTSHVKRT